MGGVDGLLAVADVDQHLHHEIGVSVRVSGQVFRFAGYGLRVLGFGFWVQVGGIFVSRFLGFGVRVSGFGFEFQVSGYGFLNSGLRSRILGFRISGGL